jgi:hypothetical protein
MKACLWLQGDLGLNICEAHAFNTSDRFSLDIFVVDGWTNEGGKESLEQALSNRFAEVAPVAQPPEPASDIAAAERRLSHLVCLLSHAGAVAVSLCC